VAEQIPRPEVNLKDRILALATRVCQAEFELAPDAQLPAPGITWRAGADRSLFPTRLRLDKLFIDADFEVRGVRLGLLDEEVDISVTSDTPPFDEDPFTKYIYETFTSVYDTHPHERCDTQLIENEPERSDEWYYQ
jgi:hypothetical protein